MDRYRRYREIWIDIDIFVDIEGYREIHKDIDRYRDRYCDIYIGMYRFRNIDRYKKEAQRYRDVYRYRTIQGDTKRYGEI